MLAPILAGLAALPAAALAQPVASAARTDTPPVIDGRGDDAAWAGATPFDAFTQVEPVEGAAPSQRTLVRVLFDRENIYILVRAFDADPARIVARQRARDGVQDGDDRVSIILDTFDDRRSAYFFSVTAAGGKRDGLVQTGRAVRVEWDSIWTARTRIVATPDPADPDAFTGWEAELALPTRAISFDPSASAWGLNVERFIRRNNERVRWATPTRNSFITNVADAGRLQGLQGLEQGVGLTFKPYVSLNTDLRDGGAELRPGFDLFYNFTPSITGALTVNTDFAEAEVDDRRVNLTRFPLFFPEKREFFLRDSQVFNFGGILQSPLPFFSRRIGLVRGRQKDILAGARVTGRHERLRFGALNVLMQDDDALGQKNLAVGRAALDIFDESTVGVIATHGDPARVGENTLAGVDLNLRTSDLPGGRTLEVNAWAMGTDTSEENQADGEASAFGGRVNYPNDKWSFSAFAARIGEAFDPALGFVERRGVYEYRGFVQRRWRADEGLVRVAELLVSPEFYVTLDGRVQSSETQLPELELQNAAGDEISLSYDLIQENLDEPFEISEGVVIPTDDYTWGRINAAVATSPGRELAARFRLRTGEFYEGDRRDFITGLDWRPGAGFFASLEHEFNDIDLPQGAFDVQVLRLRLNFLFTPEMSWSNTIQYDNVSDTAGLNSRYRWEWAPGRDFFVVLNQGVEVEGRELTPSLTELTLKGVVTFKF